MKKIDIKISQLLSRLRQAAQVLAQDANSFAKKHFDLQTVIKDAAKRISEMDQKVVLSWVVVLNVIWLCCAIAEYHVSWRVYSTLLPGDIALAGVVFKKAYLAVFVLIGLGIVVSHALRFFSEGITTLEKERTLLLHRGKPVFDTEQKLERKIRFIRIVGSVCAICLLIIVTWLSRERHEREAALLRIQNPQAEIAPFGMLDLSPTLFYLGELIAGIYLIYSIQRLWQWMRLRVAENRAKKYMKNCLVSGRSLEACIDEIEELGQEWTMTQEIEIALWRSRHRNIMEAAYTTPISINTLALFVKDEHGRPLSGAAVQARTANGHFTGKRITNTDGDAHINWLDGSDSITTLWINNREFNGIFQANTYTDVVFEQTGSAA